MRMRYRTIVSIALASLLLLSPLSSAFTYDCEWAMSSGNEMRNGSVAPGCGLSIDRLSIHWNYQASDNIVSSPIIYDSKIVFISNNKLICLDSSGKWLWERGLRGVESDVIPSVWNDQLFLQSWSTIEVYDLETGLPRPSIETQLEVRSLLIVSSIGSMFYTSMSGEYSYINSRKLSYESTPKVKRLSKKQPGKPAFYAGMIFVPTGNQLFCVNSRTMQIKWSETFQSDIFEGSVALQDGNCLFSTVGGKLYCLETTNGGTNWSYDLNAKPATMPALDSDTVIVGTDKTIKAINLDNGSLKWSFNCLPGESVSTSPVVSDRVYLATNVYGRTDTKGIFRCLDKKDGDSLWFIENTSGFNSSPAVSEGLIVFTGIDGLVTCLGEGAGFLGFQLGQRMVSIDSTSVIIDVEPVILHGRTLIPARYVVEPLGGWVRWDANERKVTSHFNGETIEFWIGKNKAKVDGTLKPIDDNPGVVPSIIDGRTMIPFRFLGDNLGCNVKWIPETKEIWLTYQD